MEMCKKTKGANILYISIKTEQKQRVKVKLNNLQKAPSPILSYIKVKHLPCRKKKPRKQPLTEVNHKKF